jgi:hypothetical protein
MWWQIEVQYPVRRLILHQNLFLGFDNLCKGLNIWGKKFIAFDFKSTFQQNFRAKIRDWSKWKI